MKTLEQINQEFLDEIASIKATEKFDAYCDGRDVLQAEQPVDDFDPSRICSLAEIQEVISVLQDVPGKKSSARRFSDVIFYVVIASILITTMIYGGKSHEGFHFLGYSGFTVLSGSMQREIPEGSLVITKSVDASEIKVGDDITFIRDDNATVTHRVVSVIDDYRGSGSRGFRTQGIENPEPDSDVVLEGNVIGLVKLTAPELGYFLSYVSEHVGVVFAIFGGILVAMIALSKFFSMREEIPEGGPADLAQAA